MKLLGVTNGQKVIASVARYDYNCVEDGEKSIGVDAGQPGTQGFAGYTRTWGKRVWFEIAENYAELYNDYNQSRRGQSRKYGVWNVSDVKILNEDEIPDTASFEWQAKNAIWGTRGKNGDEPLKYVMLKDCSVEHLENIKTLLELKGEREILAFVEYWLASKCKEQYDLLDSQSPNGPR